MRDQLARARDPTCLAKMGVGCQAFSGFGKEFIHPDGGQQVFLTDVVDDVGPVLLGGRSPVDPHAPEPPALASNCARRVANRASTSSALA